MSNPNTPENDPTVESAEPTESSESFDTILSQFERSHSRRSGEGGKQISGTVVAVSTEFVFVDIGYKTEGVLPVALFENTKETVEPGSKLQVSVKGRNEEGYYELSRLRVEQPKDWTALERAFEDKTIIVGTVTGVVKGGLTVDVGVRAFMPGSRSGARDAAEMEKLVGQEIRCRIIKLDAAEEDIVVDRRAVSEEEERSTKERRYSEGIEGMVHLSEMSWAKKVRKPGDMLKQGDTVEVMVLGVSLAERRMSLGLKQTLGDPWADASEKFAVGSQVEGPVISFTKFGAFVQLAEGIEGMVHVSEITSEKRVERPQDVLRTGQIIKAKVLAVDSEKRQIKLSMKQLVPTGLDEYIAEHSEGDAVTGRIIAISGEHATVEVGEGIHVTGRITLEPKMPEPTQAPTQPDLSSFSSMLAARWKNGPAASEAKPEPVRAGQIRSFRITKPDVDAKKIEVQLV